MKNILILSIISLLGSCTNFHKINEFEKDIAVLKAQANHHQLALQVNDQKHTIAALKRRLNRLEQLTEVKQHDVLPTSKSQAQKTHMHKQAMVKPNMHKLSISKPVISDFRKQSITNKTVLENWQNETAFAPAFNYIFPYSQSSQIYKEKLKEFSTPLSRKFTSGKTNFSHDTGTIKLNQPLERTQFLSPNGTTEDLNVFKGKKNVLLVIMRGFPGKVCITCSNQTAVLARNKKKFDALNTEIRIIYPGEVSTIPAFLNAVREVDNSFELTLSLLLDVDLSAVNKFGIDGSLAKPTSILIDKKGLVQYAYVGTDKADRPSVDTLLQQIKSLK